MDYFSDNLTTKEDLFEFGDVNLEDIKVPKGRIRKDYGDIAGLAASMAEHSQLHAIGLTEDFTLVYGSRRVLAAKLLKWPVITAKIGPFDKLLDIEIEENDMCKGFSITERIEISRRYEPIVREAARVNQSIVGGSASASGKRQEAVKEPISTNEVMAKKLSMSPSQYGKLKAVREFVDEEDNDDGADVLQVLTSSNRVSRGYARMRSILDRRQVKEKVPLPAGKFKTLLYDPPWTFDAFSDTVLDRYGYALMSDADIEELNPAQYAEDGTHLLLWVPNAWVAKGIHLLETWGFDYRSIITWHKEHPGQGHWTNNPTEQILLASFGKNALPPKVRPPGLFTGKPAEAEHSSKPNEFYDLVVNHFQGPYGEAFGRGDRPEFNQLFIKAG